MYLFPVRDWKGDDAVKVHDHHSKLLRRVYEFNMNDLLKILTAYLQDQSLFKPPPFGRWEIDVLMSEPKHTEDPSQVIGIELTWINDEVAS